MADDLTDNNRPSLFKRLQEISIDCGALDPFNYNIAFGMSVPNESTIRVYKFDESNDYLESSSFPTDVCSVTFIEDSN